MAESDDLFSYIISCIYQTVIILSLAFAAVFYFFVMRTQSGEDSEEQEGDKTEAETGSLGNFCAL